MTENCFPIGNFSIQQDVCKTQMPSIKADSKDGLRQKKNTLKVGQTQGLWSLGHKYYRKGIVTRNTHVKYRSS